MIKKLSIIFICFIFSLISGCKAENTGKVTEAQSTNGSSDISETSSLTESSTVLSQDYTKLTKEQKTQLLLGNVWRLVGEGSVRNGYYLFEEEQLKGKNYYYRFYDDNTMHEWADDTSVNRLYKWKWNDNGTLSVTNYKDTTGESKSIWCFDATYLLNENLNTTDLTPHSIADEYPKEPQIIK
ncbi:MAG: hypothetical protein BWY46_01465 [Firmicutes bacterium ADurb.Bin300]|nr:MAG: hypothetical protein BWY46_01465 [Firmicutes bacterium ADurb.Bin300]